MKEFFIEFCAGLSAEQALMFLIWIASKIKKSWKVRMKKTKNHKKRG